MKKALEWLKSERDKLIGTHWLYNTKKQKIDEAIAELEEAQETIKNLQHNYDVQVEYNNTAYKNYTNMVNSLEQRIAELEEAMKPNKARSIVAMLFWKYKKAKANYGVLAQDAMKNGFKTAHVMLKDNYEA